MDWRVLIREIPDFPISGIAFKDIAPVLADGPAFAALVDELIAAARPSRPDVIVAVEARGFIVGAPLALALGAGFVPVRKPGKLPAATRSVAYALEYGEAVLHMHLDALSVGQRVLIVDDVLATGGTLAATRQLVTEAGGEAVGALVLLELTALGGRARIPGLSLTALAAV